MTEQKFLATSPVSANRLKDFLDTSRKMTVLKDTGKKNIVIIGRPHLLSLFYR